VSIFFGQGVIQMRTSAFLLQKPKSKFVVYPHLTWTGERD